MPWAVAAAAVGAIGGIASSSISADAANKPTTNKSTTAIPKNFQSLMDATTGQANLGMGQEYQSYTAPRIGQLSPNEQQGINQAGGNNGMYQDLINMSMMNNASSQAGGGLPQPGEVNNLINPYVDYVLGNSMNRLNEQSDTNMTNIGSKAAMSGAFGGSRHGVLEGANLSELLRSTSELSSNTYSDAYDKGMGNWFKGQDLNRGFVSDGMNIAGAGSRYNTQDIANLMDTGKIGRTRDQSVLDFAYSDFMQDREDPWTKAGRGTEILKGLPSHLFDTTSTGTGPRQAPNYAASGIGGAMAGLGLYGKMPNSGSATGPPTNILPSSYGGGYGGDYTAGGSGGGFDSGGFGSNGIYAEGGKVKKSYAGGGYVNAKVGNDFNPKQTKPAHEIEYIMDMLGLGPTDSLDQNDFRELGDEIGDLSYVQEHLAQDRRMKKTTDSDFSEELKHLTSRLNSQGATHDDLRRAMRGIQKGKEAQRLSDQNQKTLTRDTQIRQPKYALGGEVTTQGEDPRLGWMGRFGMGGRGEEEETSPRMSRREDRRNKNKNAGAAALPPRPAFDFEAFADRMGIQQFMPNSPAGAPFVPNTPNVPSRTPDLSMFMQQLQQRTQGQNAPPINQNLPVPSVYAEGGFVVGGSGKNFINSLLDEDTGDDSVGIDERAFDKALKKHESAAKDYENPRYNANYFVENNGKDDSHAFGVGQWQPGTWNTFARKNKSLGLPLVKASDIEKGILPSKEHQDIMFGIWTKGLAKRHGNDYVGRWSEHQAGRGGQRSLYKADPNEKVREVLSLREARNIGSYSDKKGRKKRDETVAQYFSRVKGYHDTAKDYESGRVGLIEPRSASPIRTNASSPLDYLSQISKPLAYEDIFQGNSTPSNRRANAPMRANAPLLEADQTPYKEYPKELSLDEIIDKYSDGNNSGFTKGGKNKFSDGGKVGSKKKSGQDVYRDAINAARKAAGMPPLPEGQWSDASSWEDVAQAAKNYSNEAGEGASRIATDPYSSKSRAGQAGEDVVRGLGMTVPFINQGVGKVVQGGADALSYLFDPMSEESGTPNAPSATASGKYSLGPAGLLGNPSGDKDIESFYQSMLGGAGQNVGYPDPPAYEANADNLADATEDGTGGGGLKSHASNLLAAKDDEVTSLLKEYIASQLKEMKNVDQDPDDNDPLKSIFGDYNSGLFKMGMNILANTGNSKNDMEAIAKGVLGAQEAEETKALSKVERKNQRMKDLLNVRYLDAMTNQMSPESRMAIARENNRAEQNKSDLNNAADLMQARERQSASARDIALRVGMESLGTGVPMSETMLKNIKRFDEGFEAPIDTSGIKDY